MQSAASIDRQAQSGEGAPSDLRWELVQRVASSSAFRKSRRLREFLLFVCERALKDPATPAHEQEIGTAVFGKPADFDTAQDTLVRVQASQLRKRLEQYFSSEGAGEVMVIEIPKGSYMPVFREREKISTQVESKPSGGWKIDSRRLLVLVCGLGIILIALSSWLLLENRELRRRLSGGQEPHPAVDLLWQQVFGNGKHTYVVLADSNVTMFQDLIRLQISLNDYQRQQFKALAEARLNDPTSREFARRLMNRQYTSIADASLARRMSLLNASHAVPTDIILARDASPRHFKSHNVILSGSRRANPWMELFEDRLNFQSGFDEEARLSYFDNRSPLPGEQQRYVVDWDHVGYCRVAYLPNLDAGGSILIISGTDMASSDAGSEFITTERWVRQLRSVLGVADGKPVPHFEVLLRAHLVIGAAPNFEMIAHREF